MLIQSIAQLNIIEERTDISSYFKRACQFPIYIDVPIYVDKMPL